MDSLDMLSALAVIGLLAVVFAWVVCKVIIIIQGPPGDLE